MQLDEACRRQQLGEGGELRVAVLDGGLARTQTGLWDRVDAWMDVFGGNADDRPTNLDSNGDGLLEATELPRLGHVGGAHGTKPQAQGR